MKRKKTSKKRSSKSKKKKVQKPVKEPEMVHLEVSEELTKAPPKEPQKDNGGATKFLFIAALLIAVAVLAYYFVLQPKDQFIPGASVDETTFLNNFDSAQNVYIVMDVREIDDDLLRKNILQCGVDFAGSSGIAPKNATYYSLGDAGCVTVDGSKSAEYCFSEIRKGMAIYVHEGSTTSYYSNGIAVGVDKDYSLGTCGIHRA
jgi:hypothetical protein